MKLTKAQRHTAYIIMLAEMNPSQYYAPYLCLITKNILHIYVDLWGDGFADIFPELWAKKPYTNSLIKPQGVPHILNGTIIVLGACLSIFVIRRDIATARDERNERLLGELLNEDNAHT